MPTYEYRCDACGHEFEEVHKISDPPVERCPKCKKKKARRQISQGNFILKGGGWYVTDYKKGGSGGKKSGRDADAGAGDKKSDSKTESAADAKTESKADAKTESKSDAKTDKPAEKKASKGD